MASGAEEPRDRAAHPGFNNEQYSILVVIGALYRPNILDHAVVEIERGIRSWDVDLTVCNLDEQLKLFVKHHSSYLSCDVKGHQIFHFSTSVLNSKVVANPSEDVLYSELHSLMLDTSRNKLLILAGQSLEDTGDLILKNGNFTPNHFVEFFENEEIQLILNSTRTSGKVSLTLNCSKTGKWKNCVLGKPITQDLIDIKVNPLMVLPQMEGLQEFTDYFTKNLASQLPFDLLEPPSTVGFLKLCRPCCYIFPGGRGDCAFFAVNGFNVLVNGGAYPVSCFWKLVRHLDRIDSILLTHIGTDSLPGINILLERKVAEFKECEISDTKKEDKMIKNLISPELGVVFFNAPNRLKKIQGNQNILRGSDLAGLVLRRLEKLEISPEPLLRNSNGSIEPIILFQKMGVGCLELYVLNPVKQSKEFDTFMHSWPEGAPNARGSDTQLTSLVSICVLLVWHPFCPHEKIIRVLFPGSTPQGRILDSLGKLKHLEFLKRPVVCSRDIESTKLEKNPKRKESQDSLKSDTKESRTSITTSKEISDHVKVSSVNNSVSKERSVENDSQLKKPKLEKRVERNGFFKDDKKDGRTSLALSKKQENGHMKNTSKKDSPFKLNTFVKAEKGKHGKSEKDKNHVPGKYVKNASSSVSSSLVQNTKKKETKLNKGQEDKVKTNKSNKKQQNQNLSCDNPNFSPNSSPKDRKSACLEIEQVPLQDVPGCISSDLTHRIGSGSEEDLVNDQRNSEHEESRDTIKNPNNATEVSAHFIKIPRSECSVNMDQTLAEFTVLDGALKDNHSKHGQNEVFIIPEEKAIELSSPRSGPTSAGHTPYHLSPDEDWVRDSSVGARHCRGSESFQVSCKNSQFGSPKNKHENNSTSSKEKHSSFVSVSSFKDIIPDISSTFTSTHSMPAEVSSPQSTEVDESLSMSFEQVLPTVSESTNEDQMSYSDGHYKDSEFKVGMSLSLKMSHTKRVMNGGLDGHPPAQQGKKFDTALDVDLCLVSPCEFKHFKPAGNQQHLPSAELAIVSSPHELSDDSNHSQDGAKLPTKAYSNSKFINLAQETPSISATDYFPLASDLEIHPGMEDCLSIITDGALDSDEEAGLHLSQNLNDSLSVHELNSPPSHDPLPVPLKDLPPPPPQPGACMPDLGKNVKSRMTNNRRITGITKRLSPSSISAQDSKTKDNLGLHSTYSAPKKSTTAGNKGGVVYLDLTYLPSGQACSTIDVEFFCCLRSSCYIISGDGTCKEALMRPILDALLDGKSQWPEHVPVTLIPTFESVTMHEWYQQTKERQHQLGVTVLGSNSTVAMQEETFPACKVEF